jgi:hypothetical protein
MGIGRIFGRNQFPFPFRFPKQGGERKGQIGQGRHYIGDRKGRVPKAIATPPKKLSHFGEQVLVSICETDIQEATGMNLSKDTTAAIVASLARNITIPVTNETIIKDVVEHGQSLSEDTFYEYIKGLRGFSSSARFPLGIQTFEAPPQCVPFRKKNKV